MPFILLLLIFLSAPIQAQKLDASYEVGKDLILLEGPRVSNPDEADGEPSYLVPDALWAVLWDKSTGLYYDTEGFPTNGLTYKIDPSKQLGFQMQQRGDRIYPVIDEFYYAGNISPLERLYIDKENGAQYIKRLIPIKDPFPVYPDFDGKTLWGYTNSQGQQFVRDTSGKITPRKYTTPAEHQAIINSWNNSDVIDGVTVIMTIP